MKIKAFFMVVMILCVYGQSPVYSESLTDMLKSKYSKSKDKKKKKEKENSGKQKKEKSSSKEKTGTTKESKLEALRRKALDAFEFPEQMLVLPDGFSEQKISVSMVSSARASFSAEDIAPPPSVPTGSSAEKTLNLRPLDAFCINKVSLTSDDIALLCEWATSAERGENVYSISSVSQCSDIWYNCILCNALSELCGLTPVYWTFPSEKNNPTATGFSPIRADCRNKKLREFIGNPTTNRFVDSRYQIATMQTDGFCIPSNTRLELLVARNTQKSLKDIGKEGSFFFIRKIMQFDEE